MITQNLKNSKNVNSFPNAGIVGNSLDHGKFSINEEKNVGLQYSYFNSQSNDI